MSQGKSEGASFLLNARGSLVELTPAEAEQVSGANIGDQTQDLNDNDFGCKSYTNENGCDYNWTYDP